MSQGVGLASCLPKTAWPPTFKDELIFNPKTLVVGVSQAGMSASTIYGLDKARKMGMPTISVTADRGTPVAQHGDANLYMEIGEVGS